MNNYNYYQQPPYPMRTQQTAPALKGRPVSSLEEVRAIPVDFDGSIFYFPSLANDKIYTKQINLDGSSIVRVYELTELPIENNVQGINNLVTKEEFENKIQELTDKIVKLSAAAAPTDTQAAPAQSPTFNF